MAIYLYIWIVVRAEGDLTHDVGCNQRHYKHYVFIYLDLLKTIHMLLAMLSSIQARYTVFILVNRVAVPE